MWKTQGKGRDEEAKGKNSFLENIQSKCGAGPPSGLAMLAGQSNVPSCLQQPRGKAQGKGAWRRERFRQTPSTEQEPEAQPSSRVSCPERWQLKT